VDGLHRAGGSNHDPPGLTGRADDRPSGRATASRSAGRPPVRPVGRDAQLAELAAVLEAASHAPIACVLHGPAGIGKTTLWREALAGVAGRGYRLLACRPAESEAGLSFGGLRDLLDDLPDPLLDSLPEPQRRAVEVALLRREADDPPLGHRAVAVALLGILRRLAAESPVVLAVDDAQWLDGPTAQAIEYATRRLASERVGVLATVRSDREPAPPFGLAQGFPPERLVRVGLGGLSLGALHSLIHERIDLSLSRPVLRRVEQASAGNPFFALEIARALAEADWQGRPGELLPLPNTGGELLIRRIRQLSPAARDVLNVVSALAQPTVELVIAAQGEAAALEGLEQAEEHGVIEVHRGQVRLMHPLYGAAARTLTSSRRQLHARLAGLVEDVEQRAWHLAMASEVRDEQVADALEVGAAAAQARGALTAAAQLWELAGLRTPTDHTPQYAARMAAAGRALFHAGDTRRAWSLLDSALTGLPAGNDRARVLLELSHVVFHEGATQRAVALCAQAGTEASEPRLLVEAGLRQTWYGTHDLAGEQRAIEATLRLLTDEDAEADPDLAACVWLIAADVRFFTGQGLARDLIDRALAVLKSDTTSWAGSWALMTWRSLAKHVEDPRQARALYVEEYTLAASIGDELATGTSLMHLAELDCWIGEWQRARDEVRQSMEVMQQSGSRRWQGFVLYARGLALAYLGELDEATQAADEGLQLATELDDSWVGALHLSVLGFIAISRGDAVVAERQLTRADESMQAASVAEPARHRFHADHVEAVVATGDLDRAAELVARLEQRAQVAPYPWLLAITSRSRGVLAMARGDLDEAAAAFVAAMGVHDTLSMPFERARTLLWQGRSLRRRKEKLAARTVLSEAEQIFTSLGAPIWAKQAADELGRLGLHRGTIGELTPTEERIARLVATGMTNKEVAAATFVTVKTVEANLGRIYRKLGIHSRRELATYPPLVGAVTDAKGNRPT
jgi:DNA-binding NarL/FixJ family response regulator